MSVFRRCSIKNGLLILIISGISGCAYTSAIQATGGSKADGVVELAFEANEFADRSQIDWKNGTIISEERCKAWGYKGSEPFGGYISKCTESNQYGCLTYLITVSYQCVN